MKQSGAFFKYTRGHARTLIYFIGAVQAGLDPDNRQFFAMAFDELASALIAGLLSYTDLPAAPVNRLVMLLDPKEPWRAKFDAAFPNVKAPDLLTNFETTLKKRDHEKFRGLDSWEVKHKLQAHLNALILLEVEQKYGIVFPHHDVIVETAVPTLEIEALKAKRAAAELAKNQRTRAVQKQDAVEVKAEIESTGENATMLALMKERQKVKMLERQLSKARGENTDLTARVWHVDSLRNRVDDLELELEAERTARSTAASNAIELDQYNRAALRDLRMEIGRLKTMFGDHTWRRDVVAMNDNREAA